MVLKNWRQKRPKSQGCLDPSIHPARAFLSNHKSDPYCAYHYCCCCYFCFCRRCYHLVFQLSEFLIASSTLISEEILKPSVVLCWQFQCFFLSSQNQSPTLTHPSPPSTNCFFFQARTGNFSKRNLNTRFLLMMSKSVICWPKICNDHTTFLSSSLVIKGWHYRSVVHFVCIIYALNRKFSMNALNCSSHAVILRAVYFAKPICVFYDAL